MMLPTVLLILPAVVLGLIPKKLFEEFSVGNHKFAAESYKELVKTTASNIVSCPISAQIILSLATDGAKGSTATELIKGLSLIRHPSIRQKAFRYLLNSLNNTAEDFQLLSANKMYVAQNFTVKRKFKSIATNVYRSDVQNVDFGDNVETANLINSWVADRTNNKIQNLISSDQLNALTVMVLVNTLYLNAKWITPFSLYSTTNRTFYITPNTTDEVKTMHSKDFAIYNYCYNQTLKAKFLTIPYNNSNVSMTFILPDALDGLLEVEANLKDYLKRQINCTEAAVAVAIPQFSILTTINFKSILENLGVLRAFSPSQADFRGISDKRELFIDFVVQKAFINVTETGTEAAAATAVGISTTSLPAPPPYEFIANHPFLYFIKDWSSGVILFIGRFNNID